jgi:hypothetical protein
VQTDDDIEVTVLIQGSQLFGRYLELPCGLLKELTLTCYFDAVEFLAMRTAPELWDQP